MAEPLAYPDELADRLGITLTTQQATRAMRLLEDASAAVRNYTRQTISQVQDDTVVLEATNDEWLFLPQRPVTAVSAVQVSGAPLASIDWSLQGDALYRFRGWNGRYFGTLAFWNQPNTITVTYTHGYTSVPDDIKRVVCKMAELSWLNPGGLRSFTQGDMSAAAAPQTVGTAGLDVGDMKMLDSYRRIRRSVQFRTGSTR